MTVVKIKKIDKDAVIPHKAHKFDCGADLHVLVSQENKPFMFDWNGEKVEVAQIFNDHVYLEPRQTLVFHTGLKMAIEDGYVAKVYPRSSTGIKNKLMLANTVAIIDSPYRGELLLAFTNHSDEIKKIHHLDKLAQMEIQEVLPVEYIEVDKLDETERGEGGIGSSGV